MFSRTPCDGIITAYFGVTDEAHPQPHSGVDIAADEGTPVYAPDDGTVEFVSIADSGAWAETFGNSIILNHGDGYSLYAHMQSAPRVAVGALVYTGDSLGEVGSTGYSSGPHLHWGCATPDNPWFDKDGGTLARLRDPLAMIGRGVVPEPEPVRSAGDMLAGLAQSLAWLTTMHEGGAPRIVVSDALTWIITEATNAKELVDAG
jgi:murein DD-endopeptidase MepM/ murein hydrolase activator NlpD